MNFAFSRELEVEMADIENIFRESLNPWWGDLANLRNKLQGDQSFQLIPAAVLLAYKYLDMEYDLRIAMGNLFKTLYFANRIHSLVRDNDEGQTHNQEMQFTILIGDYIFGRVLKLLLEAGADQVLDDCAQLVSLINEGQVIKYKSDKSIQEVLQKTSAPFYSTAFLTAAKLKGLEPTQAKLYAEVGFNLGMTLELSLIGQKMEALNYLNYTHSAIDKFQIEAQDNNFELDKLVQEMLDMVSFFDTAAVV